MSKVFAPLILQIVAATPDCTPGKVHAELSKHATYVTVVRDMAQLVKKGRLFVSGPRGFKRYFVDQASADAWSINPYHSPAVCKARRTAMQSACERRRYAARKESMPPKEPRAPKPLKLAKPKVAVQGMFKRPSPAHMAAFKQSTAHHPEHIKAKNYPSGIDNRFTPVEPFPKIWSALPIGSYPW